MGKQSKRNKETIVSDENKQNETELEQNESGSDAASDATTAEPGSASGDGAVSASEAGSDDGEGSNEGDSVSVEPNEFEHTDEPGPLGEQGVAGSDVVAGATAEEIAAAGAESQASLAQAPELAALAPETPVVKEPEVVTQPAPIVAAPVTDHADAIVNYIRAYVDKMDPSKYMDAKTGVPIQKRLYSDLTELMKLDFIQFKSGMDKLLTLIFEYRHAAFSDLYSRRFFENLYPSMTHDQVREFDELLHILVTVGTQSNRSRAMSQIDLNAALKSVKNAKAQQNMSAYFSALR